MIITYVCDAFQIQNIYILLNPVNSSLMVLIVWWNRAFAPKKVLDEHGDELYFEFIGKHSKKFIVHFTPSSSTLKEKMSSRRWFHPNIHGVEAEHLLMSR